LASKLSKIETVALVGGETLIGREIRDLFATTHFPARLSLVASGTSGGGLLTEVDGEPAVVAPLDESALSEAKVAILAGTPESTRKVIELGLSTSLVDLTYAGEDGPRARLRAPVVEPSGLILPAETVHVIAAPAAIAVTLLLNHLHPIHPVRRVVVHVYEPASEHGKAGLDELQQQTVNLLSFKGLPKRVFDAQAAFNLLARFGEEAPESLEDIELRVERHLATLLSAASHAPLPSIRLIQAPVFHGESFSLWVEFEENPGVAEVERVLTEDLIDLRRDDQEPPNIVGVAGQEGVAVGAVSMDRNYPKACWLWMVSDNLRLRASNAAAVARQLL
jgi:aspartate-semialdehyde dehydrogenase